MSLSLYIFWLLSNRQGYFLTFSASDSSWLNKSGGFLNLFSWLLYSESISISILLNLSFKRWFPLWIKQRLHWFRKSTIITIRIIFIFHLTNCWFLHCLMVEIIVVYKIYLAEIKMNTKKFDMMFFLFLFSKLQIKSSQNMKKEQKFLRNVSLCWFFDFAKQATIFLNFFGQWFLLAQQEWRFSNSL